MTSEEVSEVNEKRDTHRNGNPHLYPDTLYIGAVYKSRSGGPPAGDKPYVLVETGRTSQEYLLINLHDGMPLGNWGASEPGTTPVATEYQIRKLLARGDMELVAADAKTYYEGEVVDDIEEYIKSK